MFAQTPAFLWEGDVDQSAVLHLQEDRLQTAALRGEPIQRQRYRFLQAPPDTRQKVRLEVREGRGSVRITQQPTLENGYGIAVTIEDRQDGRSHYSIALYWDASNDIARRKPWRDEGWQGDAAQKERGKPVKMTWRGHVEDSATVECHQAACRATMARGMPLPDGSAHFEKPLPRADMLVRLAGNDASGTIRIVEQPLAANDYTVRVRISDGCGGQKECRFTLEWREPEAAVARAEARRGLLWSGQVTGFARVTVRDTSTLSGGQVTGEQTLFDRPLPHHTGLPLGIRKLRGRGTAQIVETPSEQNGFSLTFEIDDPGPGAADYQVELSW